MGLIYRGNVKSLEEQVNQYRGTINQRYREVLGDEYYDKLSRVAQRVLVAECFFNSIDELNKISGERIPQETPSKFMILTDSNLSVDEDGKVKEQKARAGLGFYINDESFKHSGSSQITDKIIASYIHEYDHFIYGVLQKHPLYLIRNSICEELGYGPINLGNLTEYLLKIEKEESPKKERKNRTILAVQAYVMEEMWENSTRVLDKLILESIGINVQLGFRNREREYGFHYFEDMNFGIQLSLGGDPFRGLDDKEVVRRVINWEDYMNPIMKNEYVDNFFDSLKKVQFEVLSIPELKKRNAEEWAKYRQSTAYRKKQELKRKLKKREKRK